MKRNTYWTDPVHQSQEGRDNSFLHLVLRSVSLRAQSVQLVDKDDRRLSAKQVKMEDVNTNIPKDVHETND